MEYLQEKEEFKENLLKKYELKMYTVDFTNMVLGLLGAALELYEYELFYDYYSVNCVSDNGKIKPNWKDCFSKEPAESFRIRIFISIITAILCFLIYYRNVLYLKIEKIKGAFDELDNLRSSNLLVSVVSEVLYCAIHVPPRLNIPIQLIQYEAQFVYTLNLFIGLIMLGRVYLLWRVFILYSKWNNMNSRNICRFCGCKGGINFTVKAELKERPYQIAAGVMVISIFVFGIALRSVERPFEHYIPKGGSKLNWDYMWNGMWCTIITMATVGYGDYYARTHLGRCISVISCFWGTFLISLMVLSLTISSEFSPQESKAFNNIKKDEAEEELQEKAANAIKFAIKLKIFLRKFPNASEKKKSKWINKFKSTLIEFRTINMKLKTSEQDAPIELVLSKLNDKVTFVLDKIKNDCSVYKGISSKLETAEKNQRFIIKSIQELVTLNEIVIRKTGKSSSN